MKYNGSSWEAVGTTGFSDSTASFTQLVIDANDTLYVAYQDYGNSHKATVMKYNGSSWESVGTAGFSYAQASYISLTIAPNGIPVVAYRDDGNFFWATVMQYSFNQGDPLPVELTSFTASVKEKVVTLRWQTATEVNNYGFEIERKINNSNWSNIGFVQGSGNSNFPKEYLFSDSSPIGGSKLGYRLKQIDSDGTFSYSDEINVEIVSNKFDLSQNYPNPFNPSTAIIFSIPNEGLVSIKVFNSLGEEVTELVNETKPAGTYSVSFDASTLNSGVYFYKISTGNFVQTKKMILVK